MINKIKIMLKNINATNRRIEILISETEKNKLIIGKMLSHNVKNIQTIHDAEFSIFSQFGDDGIIQFLKHNLKIENKYFVEFGVADYEESNTRFLMMNDNWSGFVMDSSKENVKRIINSRYFWKYDLTAISAFIKIENINRLLFENVPLKDIGILHIDLDGNDYWVWKEIDHNIINPVIVIIEYNSVFGYEKALTIPYLNSFNRTNAHYSNLYWGASLRALHDLSSEKGYSFIGCNSAGNNAYFVRNDKLNEKIHAVSIENGFVKSQYRESLDQDGIKNYIAADKRLDIIKGLKVYNTITREYESL